MRRRDSSPDPLAWAAPGAVVAYVDDRRPDVVERRTVERVTGSLVVTTDGERWRRRALQASGPWAGALTVLSGTRSKHLAPPDHPALPQPAAPTGPGAAPAAASAAASSAPAAASSVAADAPAPRTRHVVWRGEDDPERLDTATVRLTDGSLTAVGTSRTSSYALAWTLTTGAGWVTRRLEVSARGLATDGGPWSRDLVLERSEDGRWRCDARASGPLDAPPPGFTDPSPLDGALDCDLGLCPVTNTMPLLRLGALDGSVPDTPLTMAWVEVPSLRVVPAPQVYASGSRPGTVRYTSPRRGFEAEITVDADGLVVDYPGLARRAPAPGGQ